jgi:hypothetical protein
MRLFTRRRTALLGALAAAAATALAGAGLTTAQVKSADALVVHEWGTFLAMSGSDGVSLDGMYHEEHALPGFVHARSRDQLRLPSVILKGETPVIYFYTDRPQRVRVDVRFPRGAWTQWYPQAQVVGPPLSQGASPLEPRDGRIVWCADVLPPGDKNLKLPATAGDALWNFARQVDAAYVRTEDRTQPGRPGELERFLFYRGLGQAPLPVRFTSAAGGTLAVDTGTPHGASHLFIVRVEGGRGAFTYRPALRPGEALTGVIPALADARPLAEFTGAIAEDVRARLVESGLHDREARAMVNTWRTSYFQTEGVRALFVLPQAWTDAFIPLEVTPRPRQLVRVMVGRIELLTPERQALAERAVGDLASPEAATRERGFAVLRDQGRYVEPIVRRVLATTGDERVRVLCRRLLATEFVTELRAATHAAANGARVFDDPVHVRAQLASVLRSIGLESEAAAEGRAALAALEARPAPALSHPDSRHYLRALARAREGLGDARGAALAYERFIAFASQVRTEQNCRGCHRDAGPTNMAWFRDWWAGKRYAALTLSVAPGAADLTIDRLEAARSADPADTARRMMLAYLYEANGQPQRARPHWDALTAGTDVRPEPPRELAVSAKR